MALTSLKRANGLQALRVISPNHRIILGRNVTTVSQSTSNNTPPPSSIHAPKKEGDISSVFQSLSGGPVVPLPPRFTALKAKLIAGKERRFQESFQNLLKSLQAEVELVASKGTAIIPEINFHDITKGQTATFSKELEHRGVAVVRGVVSEEQALQWKEDVKAYIRANPHTKAFPAHDPQVFELYWSRSQVAARAHPNMMATQKFLMSFWHSNRESMVSTQHPLTYADRLRIRQPGDATFALGAHVDGGSVERWEAEGYGRGGVFDQILAADWEKFDPWEVSSRLDVVSDLYNGAGACSMFRMYQGWLAMSHTGANEGTLLVNPMLKLATAYYLLRPFFTPLNADVSSSGYLDPSNWVLEPEQSTTLQGAALGSSQELSHALHPHLDLTRTMVHVPRVAPGDYVAWHCDTIHAVDKIHAGKSDSSVMYIPACPMTEANARYLARQREAFLAGTPGPDFPGGTGESSHVGRAQDTDVKGAEARQAMGLDLYNVDGAETKLERRLLQKVNEILG